MGEVVDRFLDYLQEDVGAWALAVLFFAAAIEYVVPPFPGDAITLVGAIMTQSKGWHFTIVFAVVTTGALVGASADYWLGRWLARRRARRGAAKKALPFLSGQGLDKVLEKFRKHGAAYIAVNRFVPGVRGLLFVAAGMAELAFAKVLAFAAISALAWDALIVGAGYAAGENREKLVAFLDRYSLIVWALLGAAVAFLVVRWLWRRHRQRRR